MNTTENNTATESAAATPTFAKKYAFTTVVVNDETRAAYTKVRDNLETTDKILFEAIWQQVNWQTVAEAIKAHNEKVAADKAAAKAAKDAAKPVKTPKAPKTETKVETPAAPANEDAPSEVIVEIPADDEDDAQVPDKIAAKKDDKTPGQKAAEAAAKKQAAKKTAAKKAPAKK